MTSTTHRRSSRYQGEVWSIAAGTVLGSTAVGAASLAWVAWKWYESSRKASASSSSQRRAEVGKGGGIQDAGLTAADERSSMSIALPADFQRTQASLHSLRKFLQVLSRAHLVHLLASAVEGPSSPLHVELRGIPGYDTRRTLEYRNAGAKRMLVATMRCWVQVEVRRSAAEHHHNSDGATADVGRPCSLQVILILPDVALATTNLDGDQTWSCTEQGLQDASAGPTSSACHAVGNIRVVDLRCEADAELAWIRAARQITDLAAERRTASKALC
ncbi:hypothetical protein IE81DRAFT_368899 [Ceraceosorus guamensis]|uniref:Uncharacterized protein n=1 Tax=Ceraceosorus guamensis TaxID=1522189 RepID=A0A316VW46_9BASI|nr:hypothetical protein IE81DRAFT_368899 [Ceraceosorus guamensis]PWN39665.1 hypothetical protein IE81DRAFT_368899 [Ceraceosorus guamensis]